MLAAWLELEACDIAGIDSIIVLGLGFSVVARLELDACEMDGSDSIVMVVGLRLSMAAKLFGNLGSILDLML